MKSVNLQLQKPRFPSSGIILADFLIPLTSPIQILLAPYCVSQLGYLLFIVIFIVFFTSSLVQSHNAAVLSLFYRAFTFRDLVSCALGSRRWGHVISILSLFEDVLVLVSCLGMLNHLLYFFLASCGVTLTGSATLWVPLGALPATLIPVLAFDMWAQKRAADNLEERLQLAEVATSWRKTTFTSRQQRQQQQQQAMQQMVIVTPTDITDPLNSTNNYESNTEDEDLCTHRPSAHPSALALAPAPAPATATATAAAAAEARQALGAADSGAGTAGRRWLDGLARGMLVLAILGTSVIISVGVVSPASPAPWGAEPEAGFAVGVFVLAFALPTRVPGLYGRALALTMAQSSVLRSRSGPRDYFLHATLPAYFIHALVFVAFGVLGAWSMGYEAPPLIITAFTKGHKLHVLSVICAVATFFALWLSLPTYVASTAISIRSTGWSLGAGIRERRRARQRRKKSLAAVAAAVAATEVPPPPPTARRGRLDRSLSTTRSTARSHSLSRSTLPLETLPGAPPPTASAPGYASAVEIPHSVSYSDSCGMGFHVDTSSLSTAPSTPSDDDLSASVRSHEEMETVRLSADPETDFVLQLLLAARKALAYTYLEPLPMIILSVVALVIALPIAYYARHPELIAGVLGVTVVFIVQHCLPLAAYMNYRVKIRRSFVGSIVALVLLCVVAFVAAIGAIVYAI